MTAIATEPRANPSANSSANHAAHESIHESTKGTVGHVLQVIGSTFDAEFPEGHLPLIYNALTLSYSVEGQQQSLVGEVQQHLGGSKVRAVALGGTDGLTRGMEVTDTGEPLQVPVGKETLGRVFNVLGQTIDQRGDFEAAGHRPIHREPPSFDELTPTSVEMLRDRASRSSI